MVIQFSMGFSTFFYFLLKILMYSIAYWSHLAQEHTRKLHIHKKVHIKRHGKNNQITDSSKSSAVAKWNQTLKMNNLLPVILRGTVALQEAKADNIQAEWRMFSSVSPKSLQAKPTASKAKTITLSDVGFIFILLFSPQVTRSAAMVLISSKLGLGRKD